MLNLSLELYLIVILLIEKKIDINATDSNGFNCLLALCRHYSQNNLVDLVRLLIKSGIDVNHESANRDTVFTILQGRDDIQDKAELVQLLTQSGKKSTFP